MIDQKINNLLPCPFCGSNDIDPEGVASFKPEYQLQDMNWQDHATPERIENRPACNNCGATTDNDWNTRSNPVMAPQGKDELIAKLVGVLKEVQDFGLDDFRPGEQVLYNKIDEAITLAANHKPEPLPEDIETALKWLDNLPKSSRNFIADGVIRKALLQYQNPSAREKFSKWNARIKLCPFCGTDDVGFCPTDKTPMSRIYESTATVLCRNLECKAYMTGSTDDESIAKWNKRAGYTLREVNNDN